MKKITFIIMLGIAVAAVSAVSPLSWKSTSLDLGEIKAGMNKDLEFEFTNESSESVTILDAKGSCGCTNVRYPKEAIAPGETAAIKATFKSSKEGVFKKNIKIKTSSSEEYTYLHFKGIVIP